MNDEDKSGSSEACPRVGGEPEPEAVIEKLYGPKETRTVPKRQYNLSDAALEQRRAAAKNSRGPTSADGKATSARNSWKHGLHASTHALGIIGKPCFSTCPKYPCSLVNDGVTKPGSGCLDKEFFLDALQKIQIAIQEKQYEGVNEVFGLTMAKNLNIVNDLQDRIASEGTVVANAKMDKDGRLIGWEHVPNPAMHALPKLMGVLGISFDTLLLTPAAIAKAAQGQEEGEKENAMTIIARTLEKMADAKGGAEHVFTHPGNTRKSEGKL